MVCSGSTLAGVAQIPTTPNELNSSGILHLWLSFPFQDLTEWVGNVNHEDVTALLAETLLCLSGKWKVCCHLPWENFF